MTAVGSFADIQRALEDTLALLRRSSPKELLKFMQTTAEAFDVVLPDDSLSQVAVHLESCGPNDRTLHALIQAIQSWDHEVATWTEGTEPHSEERRGLVLKRLGLSTNDQRIINERIPRFSVLNLPIVIAETHESWYPESRKDINPFYWRHYIDQLAMPRGSWTVESVAALEMSIDDVISRLSDPKRPHIYAVKGLVMGYVQSGKTSHFAGLIAKATDAGYRLVIILAGTLDMLRQQTQRRIDKQLVGKENLGIDEYGTDADWADFVSYGARPSQLGLFDLERLTSKSDDYTSLKRHLSALDFQRIDRSLPFNSPNNLRTAPARIAVVKKHPSRLGKLCDDLESLTALRTKLEHVPTLIIDDESDQASVNTIRPENRVDGRKRTETNRAIVRLLKLLPRAQYVGYTATPFANVFINPGDPEDLFPRDFVVSLPRPNGYMGVSDFHDFDTTYSPGDYRGNENAFVRAVNGPNDHPDNLPRAIDSFVLSGALKIFRATQEPSRFHFRHHTMMVHHRSAIAVHDEVYDAIRAIFRLGARYHEREGLTALRQLFTADFIPVSKVRAPDYPHPKSFDELLPFISECVSRVCSDNPIRIVNGAEKNRDDTPDFEQGPVWAILVGGTKLSRGYTVEGLTVTYYRRIAGSGDTLMQMGRWFGFRDGYRDLVRLFIGRSEQKGKEEVDLYEAYEAVSRDEEALRSDLLKYARHGLTPKQVPPLVRQHAAYLPPTSKNKMFNAQIESRDLSGDWEEKTMATSVAKRLDENLELVAKLLRARGVEQELHYRFVNGEGIARSFRARIARAGSEDVLSFLAGFRWSVATSPLRLAVDYIAMNQRQGRLEEWIVLVPQAENSTRINLPGSGLPKLATVRRTRVNAERIKAFSEPRHRDAAAGIAGVAKLTESNTEMQKLLGVNAPVLVIYFVDEDDPGRATVGFGIQFPGVKAAGTGIVWSVVDKANAAAVVVDSVEDLPPLR